MTITQVSRYIAPDGSEFNSKAQAEKYLAQVALIEAIMAPLAPRPDDFPYNGFLQHDLGVFTSVWNSLLALGQELVGPHEWFTQSRDLKADISWTGRLVGDLDHKAIWSLGWFRLSCTDRKTGREYSQPYYANHPEGLAVIICLNPSHPTE
jgi:hypothetical protein